MPRFLTTWFAATSRSVEYPKRVTNMNSYTQIFWCLSIADRTHLRGATTIYFGKIHISFPRHPRQNTQKPDCLTEVLESQEKKWFWEKGSSDIPRLELPHNKPLAHVKLNPLPSSIIGVSTSIQSILRFAPSKSFSLVWCFPKLQREIVDCPVFE